MYIYIIKRYNVYIYISLNFLTLFYLINLGSFPSKKNKTRTSNQAPKKAPPSTGSSHTPGPVGGGPPVG